MGVVFLNSFGEFYYYFAFLVFIFNICESESHTNSSSLSSPLTGTVLKLGSIQRW